MNPEKSLDPRRLLTVGEVAARSGVALSALHFYEARGLIASQRSGGNQRRFHREVLRRVAIIKVAQRVGIPLAEIGRALSALPEGRAPLPDPPRTASPRHRTALRRPDEVRPAPQSARR